jgi:hypothetical protein
MYSSHAGLLTLQIVRGRALLGYRSHPLWQHSGAPPAKFRSMIGGSFVKLQVDSRMMPVASVTAIARDRDHLSASGTLRLLPLLLPRRSSLR